MNAYHFLISLVIAFMAIVTLTHFWKHYTNRKWKCLQERFESNGIAFESVWTL